MCGSITTWMMGLVVLWLSTANVPAAAAEAAAAEPEFSAAVVRADFQALYQGLQDAHADLYARRSRQQYDALYERMLEAFQRPLGLSAVQLEFQRFLAYGNVAHARIDAADAPYERFRSEGGKAIAVQIRVIDGRSWIVRNLSGQARIDVGDELLAVDGEPMSRLLPQLGESISADHDYMRNTLLELRFASQLWQLRGERESFRLRIRKPDGRSLTVSSRARTRSEIETALSQQPAGLEMDWNRREARLLEGDPSVAYLRPGPFYNTDPGATDPWDNSSFVRFIDTAFDSFIEAGAQRLLIDLRDNPGGDNSFSDPMVAWFADQPFRFCSDFRIRSSVASAAANARRLENASADSVSRLFDVAYREHPPGSVFSFDIPQAQPRAGRRFEGQVFMLVNRHSYSNTVTVAALAQDYGFARILGEETSDLATTYGAMEQFELSGTGISVGYPKAHIIRPSGDLQARGVIPDFPIATPVLQSAADPVLQQALAQVRAAP